MRRSIEHSFRAGLDVEDCCLQQIVGRGCMPSSREGEAMQKLGRVMQVIALEQKLGHERLVKMFRQRVVGCMATTFFVSVLCIVNKRDLPSLSSP